LNQILLFTKILSIFSKTPKYVPRAFFFIHFFHQKFIYSFSQCSKIIELQKFRLELHPFFFFQSKHVPFCKLCLKYFEEFLLIHKYSLFEQFQFQLIVQFPIRFQNYLKAAPLELHFTEFLLFYLCALLLYNFLYHWIFVFLKIFIVYKPLNFLFWIHIIFISFHSFFFRIPDVFQIFHVIRWIYSNQYFHFIKFYELHHA
jgi:hypothetical protein